MQPKGNTKVSCWAVLKNKYTILFHFALIIEALLCAKINK